MLADHVPQPRLEFSASGFVADDDVIDRSHPVDRRAIQAVAIASRDGVREQIVRLRRIRVHRQTERQQCFGEAARRGPCR